ncbi:kinase-like domain-containing protein [Biscogniauxia marginata]|nr:kinase-like domain-containing protein [Biscogniauxia marginata]
MKVATEAPGFQVPRLLGTKIINVHESPKECIMMSHIPGRPLSEVWPELNITEKHRMAQRLRDVLRAIRAVPQPPKEAGQIMSCDGGPIRLFVPMTIGSIQGGPFNDEGALNNWLVSRLKRAPLAMRTAFEETLNTKTHSIVFTHGDLNLSNIIVNDEDKSLVVLDWGYAGWLPEWVEYARFLTFNHRETDIANYAGEIFEKPYSSEVVNWMALGYYLL